MSLTVNIVNMETNMYNELLEELIEMALLDGNLTDKEKQVLFDKAKSLGIDPDEFEMVLNAKLYEKKIGNGENVLPKSDKYGDIKKCPACGAIVKPFKLACKDCGHIFSNIDSTSSIKMLFKMLEEAESQRKDYGAASSLVALGNVYAKALGGVDKIANSKKEIIRNFLYSQHERRHC